MTVSAIAPATDFPVRLENRIPVLDSLRGVAILSVFLYHAFFWSGMRMEGGISRAVAQLTRPGWLGVDLFFVLSGFLITGRLLDRKHDAPGDYYRWFYTRRAVRILPLYYTTLLVVGSALWWTRETTLAFLAASVVFIPNIALLIGWWTTGPLAVLWSLGVEEQVYLVWPFLVRTLTVRRLAWMFVGIGLVEPLLRWLTFSSGLMREGLSIATWLRLDGFAWGGLVAIVARVARPRLTSIGAAALLASTAGAVVCAFTGTLSQRTVVGTSVQLACADLFFAGLVAVAVSRWSDVGGGRSVLGWFGRISYCLYLVHLFVFWSFDRLAGVSGRLTLAPTLLRAVIVLAVSTIIAELSWRYLEGPSLEWGRPSIGEPAAAKSL
jgi:peptidoglycan/LPS O-acetylase OafA/YrhL